MERDPHNAAARYCELLYRHERMLRWQCLRRAHGDPSLADDYFQEVALTLWRQLPTLEPGIPLRQEREYVKQAARFTLGHCSRRKPPDLRRLQAEMAIAFGQRSQEDELSLNSLVDALPGEDRMMVELYRAGYTATDMALFLGMRPNTVSQRLRRAVARMREMYEKECDTINDMHHGQ